MSSRLSQSLEKPFAKLKGSLTPFISLSDSRLAEVTGKLKPYWYKIYRKMITQAFDDGLVKKELFASVCLDCGVYLTNQDLKAIQKSLPRKEHNVD